MLDFFAGGKPDGKLSNTTGLAISEDAGATWRYHSDQPVLPRDRSYDAEGTGSVWVLNEGGRLRLYYTSIGHYFPKPEGVQTGHGDTLHAWYTGNRFGEVGIGHARAECGGATESQ